MRRSLIGALLLCLFLFATGAPGLAQAERETGDNPGARMTRAGWKIQQEGVLRRERRAGEVETFVFGVAGFTWKLRDLRSQLQFLRREYEANPTPELRRAIAGHRKAIASTLETIERARAAGAGVKQDVGEGGCNLRFAYDAEAAPKVNVRGTWAAASADFTASESCEHEGEVYAVAFAKATVNGAPTTATVTDGPRTGSNVSASADANRNGGPACESYAYSYVVSNALEPTSYSTTRSNESCPTASAPSTLQVSIASDHGDSLVLIPEGECRTVNWTVSVSGGTPPYTSSIYRNGVFQRTGTSYSEQFCFDQAHEENYVEYVDVTISAHVADSGSQSALVSHETTLRFRWWLY